MRGLLLCLITAGSVAGCGCGEELLQGSPDGSEDSTATDTLWDSLHDTATDTGVITDSGVLPDTIADTVTDPGTDPGYDSGHDPGFDSGFDSGFDPGYDPGFDPGYDSGYDPGYDPSYDSSVDPGTDAEIEPCIAVNDGPLYSSGTTMGGIAVGLKFTTVGSLTINRCEVFTGIIAGYTEIGVWSHDTVADTPHTDLGTDRWSMVSAISWQGADFSPPIALSASTTYWFVWDPLGGEQASMQPTGTTVEYRGRVGFASWNGPYLGPWKVRCFCE